MFLGSDFVITFILMLAKKIAVAGTVGAIVGVCWVLYLILFSAVRPNRTKRNYKTAAIIGTAATLVCDIVWSFKFFDNFTYLNPELKTFGWLLLLPAALLVLVMFQSYFNIGRFEHEQKQRMREAEKQRKKDSRRKKHEDMPPPPPAPEK